MNPTDQRTDVQAQYHELLALLANTLKYVEAIGVDPKVVESYKRLLRYLRACSPDVIADIVGEKNSKKPGRLTKAFPPPSDEEILRMTSQRIVDLASNPDVPRSYLERIATVRFGMTTGGLSNLRSRAALLDKLRTLIGNENAHDAIARAAVRHRPE
jgi:hypothetical protein